MDFYKDYPQCDYSVYFNAPVNAAMENRILSSLAPLVQGRNEADAANILINFVQTAFQYQTDGQQFGYEKPFFVEELFYYPIPIARTVRCCSLIWCGNSWGLMSYCWITRNTSPLLSASMAMFPVIISW